MKLTRFERKILAAILAAAVLPFLGTVFLGRTALFEAYQVGVNPRVEAELERSLETHRALLGALRDEADLTADTVAFDRRLGVALAEGPAATTSYLDDCLVRYQSTARIEVLSPTGSVTSAAERAQRLDEDRFRLLVLERTVGEFSEGASAEAPDASVPAPPVEVLVRVTVAAPAELFVDYQRAGEVTEVYSRLEAGASRVSGFYFAIYLGFLFCVTVVAVAVGVLAARRVTRRVADLAEATARVGAGDLAVTVPTDSNDEVGELTRAFNAMVADLRSSRDRIEYLQRIGAWQDFARRLAHEIKNPLTPIQLAAQEVEKAYTGTDEAYAHKLGEARSIIEEEVATLRRLVGEFSEFARLPQAELAPADLGEFIGDLARSLSSALEVPDGVEVRFETLEEPVLVSIDAMMLKRCVDNLVRNAVEALALADGGVVVVSAHRDGDRARIEVVDDGPGIDADARPRIFDPYYTTKAEGTGLGLAIVKKVVLEHGGDISCEPREEPETGTRFVLSLPVASVAPGPEDQTG
ncbi:MAG: histidine kinase [Deltaproteobacteria bacterium]|nr:MAG: histidine kinase [Deltaproteobacteria bacterium]